jgi:hypothetical protein
MYEGFEVSIRRRLMRRRLSLSPGLKVTRGKLEFARLHHCGKVIRLRNYNAMLAHDPRHASFLWIILG